MARRRSTSADESSLELLLDTICNAFGGILFISILIIVLINMSSKEVIEVLPEQPTTVEMLRLRSELEEADEQLKTLTVAASQQKNFASMFVSKNSAILANEIRDKKLNLSQSVQSNNQQMSQTVTTQKNINEISEKLDKLKHELIISKEQLSNINIQLKQEIAKRSRSSKLPTVKMESKAPDASYFLQQGVLCFLGSPKEIMKTTEGKTEFVVPNIAAGLKISSDSPNRDSIADNFDSKGIPKRHLIRFWVSPDSHTEWNAVRETLVKRGNRYELRLLPKDVRLSYGRSSQGTRSQ